MLTYQIYEKVIELFSLYKANFVGKKLTFLFGGVQMKFCCDLRSAIDCGATLKITLLKGNQRLFISSTYVPKKHSTPP